MKKTFKRNLDIDIILIIVATTAAILRFSKGEIVDGFLWCVISLATLIRVIRRYLLMKNSSHD